MEIRELTKEEKQTFHLKNEPFLVYGRVVPSLKLAKELGYIGLYTICQDNNLGAATFYLKNHFVIGGFDNQIYRGTAQEGKSDILFYLSVKE